MAQEIKISDWLCIAQEGKTIDGREIKREWLESAVKNYSPEFYQALIWCEHEDVNFRLFSPNLGTVEELKLEGKNGKLRLLARLRANAILQSMNEQEQKIYSSVEIMPNFPDEGEFYLVGLAATDQPASTGLSRLSFSTNKNGFRTAPVLLFGNNEISKPKQNINLLKLINREKYSMTQEEIDALLAQLAEANNSIQELQEQNKKLLDQLENGNTEAAQETAEEIQDQIDDVEKNVDTAQDVAAGAEASTEYSKLAKQIAQLKKQNDALQQRFNALSKTPINQQKPGIGARKFGIELH